MAAPPITERQKFWRDHVLAAAAFGGTIVEYAKSNNLKTKDIYQWKTSLAKRGLLVHDYGSFTLTIGVLNRDPIRMGAGAATANGAIDGFVVGSAIEMPRGLRINVVSPGLLDVSEERYGSFFSRP